jgi:Holliday junction resolvasome RuvABC ATP-dependent DNA helicase subunit
MPAARPQPREWRPVKAPIRYEGSNFRMVEGLDDVKAALDLAMRKQHETRVSGEDRRLHILLAGPPGVSKSLLLLEAEKEIPQERRVFVLGSQVSKAGLRNRLLSSPSSIDFVLIDELDKMGREDYDVLLSMMESGRISVLKAGMAADARVLATVLATANYLERIPVELLDRFLILYVESYDSQDFVRVATRLLRERGAMPPEEASALAAVLWNSGFRSIRDVVRVANAARGDPGKAYQLIEIMRARSPPSELVRSRGWRPRR